MHALTVALFFSPKKIFSFAIALGLMPEQGKCLAESIWAVDNAVS